MDPLAKKRLEESILGAVQGLLAVGDRSYLQGLSRPDFIEALENELRFVGLYCHDDAETPAMIHAFIEQYIDQWRIQIEQQKDALSHAQQSCPEIRIHMSIAPFVQTTTSTTSGIPLHDTTRYVGFMPPMERTRIQVSPSV